MKSRLIIFIFIFMFSSLFCLLLKAQFLQPIHYENVVVERSVARLCGYPLCMRPLSDDHSKRGMFHIDYHSKRVLDNTEIKVCEQKKKKKKKRKKSNH